MADGTLPLDHQIGANNPPVDEPATPVPADPFDAIKLSMDDRYVETANWADGADIETPEQLAVVEQLINDWKLEIGAAEAARDSGAIDRSVPAGRKLLDLIGRAQAWRADYEPRIRAEERDRVRRELARIGMVPAADFIGRMP